MRPADAFRVLDGTGSGASADFLLWTGRQSTVSIDVAKTTVQRRRVLDALRLLGCKKQWAFEQQAQRRCLILLVKAIRIQRN